MGKEKLETLVRWVEDFEEATVSARKESERDRDYYDGEQWSTKEIAELNERRQPVITINRIASKVNFVLGTEIRTRVDPKAMPRTPMHQEDAEAITDSLRFVADNVNLHRIRGSVAKDMVVSGYAATVTGIEKVKASGDLEVTVRFVPWDRFFYDPRSYEADYSDAKYTGVITWMDKDDVVALYSNYPGTSRSYKSVIERTLDVTSVGNTDDTFQDKPKGWVDGKRKRLKVVEIYYRVGKKCYSAHFLSGGFIVPPARVPFKDDKGRDDCPLVGTSAYIDRNNCRYGMIRNSISPQDEVNKRRSKALHIINMRQVRYERGAVDDIDTALAQLARPDGAIETNPGLLFEVLPTGDMAAAQFNLLAEAKAEIDQTGPSAALGGRADATSGRELMARQQGGSVELASLFENLRQWELRVYRQIWFRIKQFWTEERWLRVTDTEQGWKFVGINRRVSRQELVKSLTENGASLPEALQTVGVPPEMLQMLQQAPPEAQQQIQQQLAAFLEEEQVHNDVGKIDVDIIVEQAPDIVTIQQEQFDRLTGLAQSGVVIPPDVLIEASQLRNKTELLRRMRPSPEQQQKQAQEQQQQQQVQQQAQQLQIAGAAADIEETRADTVKKMAQAKKAEAEAGESATDAILKSSGLAGAGQQR